jgi:hypothetical protein
MKTIFDKIDPKYIECATGTCEHMSHSTTLPMYVATALVLPLIYIMLKTKKI